MVKIGDCCQPPILLSLSVKQYQLSEMVPESLTVYVFVPDACVNDKVLVKVPVAPLYTKDPVTGVVP